MYEKEIESVYGCVCASMYVCIYACASCSIRCMHEFHVGVLVLVCHAVCTSETKCVCLCEGGMWSVLKREVCYQSKASR